MSGWGRAGTRPGVTTPTGNGGPAPSPSALATWWRMCWLNRWFWPWLAWLPGGDD